MRILALDLGSTTGYAYGTGELPERRPVIGSRTWASPAELRDMRARRLDRRGDLRVVRFYDWLTNLHSIEKFDAIVFEDVRFHTSTAQTQLWSSFRTTIWLAFPRTLIECVDVGTLKKYATGSGAADKALMAKFFLLNPNFAGSPKVDDNAIDAAWLWLWGQDNLKRIKP